MTRTERAALDALMKQFGIQRTYRAADGSMVRAPVDAVLAVLAALGADVGDDLGAAARRAAERTGRRTIDPVIVAWDGRLAPDVPAGELQLERGDTMGTRELPDRLPPGYHTLRVHGADDVSVLVIAAPRRCYTNEDAREWGVFAPLYALRATGEKPIGDFADLGALMRWITELDGSVVATLPVSAAFLRAPFEPSPYAPASRLFWNEIYLHQEEAPAAELVEAGPGDALVNYRAVAEMKRAGLEPHANRFFDEGGNDRSEFRSFMHLYPDAENYARFRAAGERFASGWPAWPAPARSGTLTRADFAESALRFHWYAQFLAHRQLAALASEARQTGARLYLDLPLGVHPDSFDIWCNRDLFVTAVSAGAPPDAFFTKGQNWGFPPLNPVQLRQERYRYWRRVLQTQLRYAGILRLDHVMALHRLYFVPSGFDAASGVYVRYPAEELYAVLALESLRHRATIVGEDLGTVPAEVRKAMARHAVKRMFVVQFEATAGTPPLSAVPASAVASLNTHDMPTFQAYWEGRDADLRLELGLIDPDGVAATRETRTRTTAALSLMLGVHGTIDTHEARSALYELLARSPAEIVLLNLEDLWLENEPQNVPGTAQERPNWQRRLRYTLAELCSDAGIIAALEAVARARRAPESAL